MNHRLIEALKKLKEQQTVLENEIKGLQTGIKQMQIEMPEKIIDEAQEGLKNYSIINGYWHLDDENLGIKAEGIDGLPGKDGKDGKDGRDGLNGLPGKMGLPGKDGKDGAPGKDGHDGKDGKDGKDGIDGITPEFEVGKIKSVSTYDPAKVELIKNENKYIINMDIPRGRPGSDGNNGKDATINGESTVNIEAGEGIDLKQENKKLIISSTSNGGSDAETIFDVSCTISLATMTVSNVSSFSEEIIKKRNEGNLIRMNCTFVENPKMNVVVILNVIDGEWTFFYPVIRGDIGQGMKTYVFRLGVGKNNATISAHAMPETEVDILTEFDIEYTYEDNQVYNANAIHQLLELFVYEITMIQEQVTGFEDRLSALENK